MVSKCPRLQSTCSRLDDGVTTCPPDCGLKSRYLLYSPVDKKNVCYYVLLNDEEKQRKEINLSIGQSLNQKLNSLFQILYEVR